jgi:hypothetical protein
MTTDPLDDAEAKLRAIEARAAERAQYLQPNQCPGCGAYRLDGKPPMIHEHGCQWEGDWLDNLSDYLNPDAR